MPAGDAGLERQTATVMDWPASLLAQSCAIPAAIDAELAAYVDPDHRGGLRAYLLAEIRGRLSACAEIDRLQVQLAAQQAVIDAARELWQVEPAVSVRSAWKDAHLRLADAFIALDAQAAQPESEPR